MRATTKDVRNFFGANLTEMKAEWLGKGDDNQPTSAPALTKLDKEQILDALTVAEGQQHPTYDYTPTTEQIMAARAKNITVPGGPEFSV